MIVVIDDFLPDIEKERQRALACEYGEVRQGGGTFCGISPLDEEKLPDKLVKLVGENRASSSFYRAYLRTDPMETFIHSDSSLAEFTAVLFLSKPEQAQSGIAFWRHKSFDWMASPTPDEMKARGVRDTPEFWRSLKEQGHDPFAWELIDYVPTKLNRMVLFWSSRFHSRHPQKVVGETKEDARLVKVFLVKAVEK